MDDSLTVCRQAPDTGWRKSWAAADPRIDALREQTIITEDPRYSRDFYDPEKRSSSNAVQVFFTDGTSTPKVEVEYPIGHPRRRSEVMPVLKQKFEASLGRHYPPVQRSRILKLVENAEMFERTAVHEFVDMLVI